MPVAQKYEEDTKKFSKSLAKWFGFKWPKTVPTRPNFGAKNLNFMLEFRAGHATFCQYRGEVKGWGDELVVSGAVTNL